MNKAEFLAALATQYDRVGDYTPANTNPADIEARAAIGQAWYQVAVVKDVVGLDGELLSKTGKVSCYVYDEGLPGEVVKFQEKADQLTFEAPAAPDTSFVDGLKAFLDANVPPAVKKYQLTEIAQDVEFAIIRAMVLQTGEINEKFYIAWRTAGVWDYAPYNKAV